MNYKHTEDMGEISGFGGGYEESCQNMLDAGVKWLNAHPDADPQFRGYKGVYGILSDDNEDAQALSDVVCKACDDCTGAMHQAVCMRLMFIKANGWDAYCEELRKRHAEEGNAG